MIVGAEVSRKALWEDGKFRKKQVGDDSGLLWTFFAL